MSRVPRIGWISLSIAASEYTRSWPMCAHAPVHILIRIALGEQRTPESGKFHFRADLLKLRTRKSSSRVYLVRRASTVDTSGTGRECGAGAQAVPPTHARSRRTGKPSVEWARSRCPAPRKLAPHEGYARPLFATQICIPPAASLDQCG